MTQPASVPMSSDTRFYRYLALGSHLALLCWMILWHSVLTDVHTYSPLFIVLVYIVPLVLPLKGIIQAKPYTHAWANFVVLFYVIHGITTAYAVQGEMLYAIIELILATTMFTGCSVFARKRGRELGLGLKKLKEEMREEQQRFEGE